MSPDELSKVEVIVYRDGSCRVASSVSDGRTLQLLELGIDMMSSSGRMADVTGIIDPAATLVSRTPASA
jgi:hypothetical protein